MRVGWLGQTWGIFFLLNFEGRLARRRLGVFSFCSTMRVGWLRRLGVFSFCSTMRVGWLGGSGYFRSAQL